MLEEKRGFSAADLAAVRHLETRVVAADGGRLKLEYGSLEGRTGDHVDGFVWREPDQSVTGFVGIYGFSHGTVELAGMVDPDRRRQGIATRLLDASLAAVAQRGKDSLLLIVPRPSDPGHALARVRGGDLEHSEHAMLLPGDPADGPSDPALSVRRAEVTDAAEVGRLLHVGFDWEPPDQSEVLRHQDDAEWTVVIERGGRAVGTARLTLHESIGGIYGFAVDPALQGQGIGRDALRRFCRDLRARGAAKVGLEVAVENERALGLYTSIGFEPVITEDYYELRTG